MSQLLGAADVSSSPRFSAILRGPRDDEREAVSGPGRRDVMEKGPGERTGSLRMANRRKTHLDALEDRLTGPRRIGLFGHRNVGKTTLLAMFYRQASTGQVAGLRLAAGDPASAEYLAEKIAQIESGEPPAGTLAETELRLRLYHGAGAVRPDRQGLPGRARHARLRRADPGVLRRLRRRPPLPRPRGVGTARRPPEAAAGSREPPRALHRPLGRRHHRPARGAALDQVRPRARPGPGHARTEDDDDPRPGGSSGWSRRSTG